MRDSSMCPARSRTVGGLVRVLATFAVLGLVSSAAAPLLSSFGSAFGGRTEIGTSLSTTGPGPSSAADRSGRRHRTDCVCGPGRGYSRLSTRCVAQQLDVVGRPGWRPTGTVSDRDGVRPSGWVRAPLRRVRTGLRPVGYVGLRVRDLDEPHGTTGATPRAGPTPRWPIIRARPATGTSSCSAGSDQRVS